MTAREQIQMKGGGPFWTAKVTLFTGVLSCALFTFQARAEAPRKDEEKVREVSLEELFPSPPSRLELPFEIKGTAVLTWRTAPVGDWRQRMEDMVVPSVCNDSGCIDGLKDLRTGRELLRLRRARSAVPDGSENRALLITHVSPGHVSVYIGISEYNGGVHANNELRCVTYERSTGKPVSLFQLMPTKKARVLLQQAREKLHAFTLDTLELNASSFLYDAASSRIFFCATYPDPSGYIIEIPVAF